MSPPIFWYRGAFEEALKALIQMLHVWVQEPVPAQP